MSDEPSARAAGRSRRRAVAGYVALWLLGAALVVGILVALLDGAEDENVALPPVRQIDFMTAAQRAGCEVRRPRRGEVTNPPVDGAAEPRPASPGFKKEAPKVGELLAALRRGVVVIHFRPGLDEARVEQLEVMQRAVPDGTIVTPNATGMRPEVAATAFRRLLSCPRYTDATLDALRLFRGRYVGSGPDG